MDGPNVAAVEPERAGDVRHVERPLHDGLSARLDELEARVEAVVAEVLAGRLERRLGDCVVP